MIGKDVFKHFKLTCLNSWYHNFTFKVIHENWWKYEIRKETTQKLIFKWWTISPPDWMMESFDVVLPFEPVYKILTIQMKPLLQYFHKVQFVFRFLQNILYNFVQFGSSCPLLRVKGLNLILMLLMSQNFELALVIWYCYELISWLTVNLINVGLRMTFFNKKCCII